MDLSPYLAGEVIGDRYRLVRQLGSGGMGVVWVAHSLVLGVDVALKLICARSAGPAVSSRMAREAHAAARLGHPALVRVFDFGWTSRGDPFLVMELVQGETLSAVLDRDTRIPAIRAVQMLLPVADGLRLAHDKNIIHRDIKPDNIFVAADAFGRLQPKLLDFGIAKVDPAATDGKLTQVGVVLGSPEYMSPEQALGVDEVDERTDVWSLSVVLYEMVTGTVPFKKANYNALMHAIIHETPLPIVDQGAGDAALWRVVERGLAKEREQRWANMTELGEALALWLYEHGIKEDVSGNSIRAVWLDGMLSGVRADLPPSAPPPGLANETPPSPASASPTVDLPGRGTAPRAKRLVARTLAVLAAVGAIAAIVLTTSRPELEGLRTVLLPSPAASVPALQPPALAAARSATPAVAALPLGSARPPASRGALGETAVSIAALPVATATAGSPNRAADPSLVAPKATSAKKAASGQKPASSTAKTAKPTHDFGF